MRRELKFKDLNDARRELELLSQGPVETLGEWSYFQILNHLAKATEGSMKGKIGEMSWWKRHVQGPVFYGSCAWRGSIPAGIGKKPGVPVERVEGDEKAALTQLLKVLEDFEKFEGKLSEHPRMGPLNKRQWTRFHTWHLANHLGNVRRKL